MQIAGPNTVINWHHVSPPLVVLTKLPYHSALALWYIDTHASIGTKAFVFLQRVAFVDLGVDLILLCDFHIRIYTMWDMTNLNSPYRALEIYIAHKNCLSVQCVRFVRQQRVTIMSIGVHGLSFQ